MLDSRVDLHFFQNISNTRSQHLCVEKLAKLSGFLGFKVLPIANVMRSRDIYFKSKDDGEARDRSRDP